MATFREWLVFDQIREEVYGESLRRLHIHEALRRTFEFYNMAVAGEWELILENSLDDEDDDGIVPDYDPFADGDENASPAWEAPKGQEEEQEEETPAPAKKKSRKPEIKIFQAKTIQRYAQIVRWAAMLDRREAVERVRQIYNDEIVPLLRKNEGVQRENTNDDDDDDDWGSSYWIDSKQDAQPAPTQSAQPASKPASPSGPSRLSVVSKLRPLLEKLGYLEEGELDYGTEEEKFEKTAKAAAAAANEKGNDPPNNPDVQMLIDNPESRAKHSEFLMSEIGEILKGTARRVYRQIRRLQGSEGGEKKYGSEMDEDEILNKGVDLNISKLQRRFVRKDGTAQDWNNDLKVLTISVNDEEGASRLINTIKSPISTPERALRDDRRAADKASGQRPGAKGIFTCPDCGHTRAVASKHVGTKMKCPKCQSEGLVQQAASAVSHDAGATGEDGTVTSMDVADPKSRDSLSNSIAEENRKTLVNAFRQAMIELRDSKPALAVLACLWMQLDCAPNGSVSDENIARFFSAASGMSAGSRQSPENFINRLALDQQVPGAPKQKSELGEWALVKIIASRRSELQSMPRMGGMPPGTPPDRPPSVEGKSSYASRHLLGGVEKAWYDYMKKVADAKRDALKIVIGRMHQIIAEKDSSARPKGWRSPCTWSLFKFLKDTYHDAIGKTMSIGDGNSNPITVTFFNKHKKSQKIREYSLSTNGGLVTIVQTLPAGYEGKPLKYEIPQNTIKCDTCRGAGGDCPECEGCGSTMDRVATINLERSIKSMLDMQRRPKTL